MLIKIVDYPDAMCHHNNGVVATDYTGFENSVLRVYRELSNESLQALVLLSEPQNVFRHVWLAELKRRAPNESYAAS